MFRKSTCECFPRTCRVDTGGSGPNQKPVFSAPCRGPSLRGRPQHSTTSKVAYFKRKYAEEEDVHGRLRGYFQKHLILQEDRGCILKLSLEKLRFLEDPEAYLRRSVLINNLLRKIHREEEELEAREHEEVEAEDEERLLGGRAQRRLPYPDRKRGKVLVMDCCYRLVPCYPFGLPPNHRLLLYDPDDHG
ncbi:SERTA domain-containing protein 4 isoform 1-T1 [Spinachia spinachia]